MSNSEQIFQRGYLNTYIIGSVPSFSSLDLVCKDKEEVFIFIDFNNAIKGLYYPKMLELIIQETQLNNGVFPSILINDWKVLQKYLESYAETRNIKKFHVIYFSEGGQSYYHKNILKTYKSNRKSAIFQINPTVSNYFSSYDDIQELIRNFIISSWKWIEYYSKQANILSIRLENLDADFIPELLLRQYDIYNDNAVYLILSSDGDYLQTLDFADNVYIFDGNTLITDKNWLNSKQYLYPKISNQNNTIQEDNIEQDISDYKNNPIVLNELGLPDISADKIILYKALVGDTSDHIPGIKGIGVKGFFNKFIQLIPNNIRADDIDSILDICKEHKDDNKICNKIINDSNIFKDMIKLVSFKMVINWLMLNKQRYDSIDKIIKENISALTESCYLKKLEENLNG